MTSSALNEPHSQRVGLPSVFTKNFGVTAVMKTSVLLTWEVPESFKSEVPLKVRPDRPVTKETPACRRSVLFRCFSYR